MMGPHRPHGSCKHQALCGPGRSWCSPRLVPTILFAALIFSACSDDSASSEVFEYCTPMSASATRPPEAAVALDPAEKRPTAEEAFHFLIGTEYPLTTLDASTYTEIGGSSPTGSMAIQSVDLAVVDASSIAPTDQVVGRAEFDGFDLAVAPIGPLGTDSGAKHYDGILGGDLLTRYALRLSYQPDLDCRLPWSDALFPTLTFFREFTDENDELAEDGFAVISFDISGGGKFLLSGDSHDFKATRIGIGACIQPAPFDPADLDPADVPDQDALDDAIPVTGTNAFLLVATGTVPVVLGAAFFERLKAAADGDATATYSVRDGTLYQPQGPVEAKVTNIERIALVGDTSDGLAPCGELARRRRIAWILAHKTEKEWASGTWHISTAGPAVAEFDGHRTDATAIASLDAYVIPDESTLLQGVRFELGNDLPEVDGFVGHEFLRHFEFILDYPNERLILRCAAYKSTPDDQCPSDDSNAPCCDTKRRCTCPANQPCCQYPATKIP